MGVNKRKVVVPKEHPLAWQSKLWPHEELIRSMRRARKTWKAIAEHLLDEYKIPISHQAVRNFLDRASNPKPKRKKTLKGFNPPTPGEPSEVTTMQRHTSPSTPEVHAKKEDLNTTAHTKTPDELKEEFERLSEDRQRQNRSKQTSFGPPPNLDDD